MLHDCRIAVHTFSALSVKPVLAPNGRIVDIRQFRSKQHSRLTSFALNANRYSTASQYRHSIFSVSYTEAIIFSVARNSCVRIMGTSSKIRIVFFRIFPDQNWAIFRTLPYQKVFDQSMPPIEAPAVSNVSCCERIDPDFLTISLGRHYRQLTERS